MNIIYISPNNYENPHLFPTFIKTFEKHGHSETNNPNEATHCFIEFVSGESKYDKEVMNIILDREIKLIAFDNREWGSLNGDAWLSPPFFDADIWFVRNMSKAIAFPQKFYPFDWPYFEGHDFHPASKEELFSRPNDVCFFGTESPARKNVIDGILKDGRLKLKYEFRDHTKRIPYDQWLNEHRQAKLYLSCEGGGMTNERPLQLFSISPMLNVINSHLAAHSFEDGINCLEISQHPTSEEIEKIIDIISDKNWLYDIYIHGIEHTKKYLSNEAVANYVLKTINEHSDI